jgi:hypothetical protein
LADDSNVLVDGWFLDKEKMFQNPFVLRMNRIKSEEFCGG